VGRERGGVHGARACGARRGNEARIKGLHMALLTHAVLVRRLHPSCPSSARARAWEELSSKHAARLSSGGARGERRRCTSLGRVGCVMEMWSASRSERREAVGVERRGLADCARARFGTARLAAAALCAAKGRFAGRAAKAEGPSVLHTPVHLRGVGTCAVSGRCSCSTAWTSAPARMPWDRWEMGLAGVGSAQPRTDKGRGGRGAKWGFAGDCPVACESGEGVGGVGGGCVCYCEAPMRGDTARKDPIFWQFT
jgi:hypothetical protein